MAIFTFGDTYAELQALFTATFSGNWNTIAQNAASPATNLYLSLHTAAPGNAGSQTTSETAYTNYARVAVPRTTGGWTVTQGSGTTFSNVTNAAAVNFPACGATGATLTHWGLGLASSGAGTLLGWGPLGPTAGPAVPFEATAAAPGVFTTTGYSPTNGDTVMFYQTSGSQGLPGGITEGTIYTVAGASGITFNTGTTTSTAGSGMMIKASSLVVSSGITPSFAIGAFSLQRN